MCDIQKAKNALRIARISKHYTIFIQQNFETGEMEHFVDGWKCEAVRGKMWIRKFKMEFVEQIIILACSIFKRKLLNWWQCGKGNRPYMTITIINNYLIDSLIVLVVCTATSASYSIVYENGYDIIAHWFAENNVTEMSSLFWTKPIKLVSTGTKLEIRFN